MHVFPCYLLNAWLVTARTCQRNAEIQCSSDLSLAINCEKQKEKTCVTYSYENSVSETTDIAPSSMLDHAFFVSEQQWSSGLESVLLTLPSRNVDWFTDVWSTYSEKWLQRLSGYLDLHLCFYWVAFVTPLKKTPSLKSLSPRKPDQQFEHLLQQAIHISSIYIQCL